MKIKINGFTWTVIFFHRTNESFDGQTSESNMIIRINVNQNPQIVKATITHELVHAHLDSFGFGSYCKNRFTLEELCEFVAMNNEKIKALTDQLMKEVEKYIGA